ncbi:MAG: acylphosphatase, partial [Pirellula sp.]
YTPFLRLRFPTQNIDFRVTMRRVTCFFSGRVQGVGFRFHTKEVAKKFSVQGTVQNLDDGRVKVVAEGEKDEIHRFLDAVSQSMTGNVKGDERFESDASSEFESFVALW